MRSHLPDRQAAKLYVCAAMCALLFAVLAIMVVNGSTIAFDMAIRNHIHAWASAPLTQAAQALTFVGSAFIWVPGLAIVIAALAIKGERRPVLGLVLVMAGAVLLDNGIKLAFHRLRPETFFGAAPDTFSFPSGHALFNLCFYGALAAVLAGRARSPWPRIGLWLVATVLVLGIAWSRLYLGVHYPTDVLAGLLVGGAWLCAVGGTGLLRSAGDVRACA